ncbi:MAG: hypothetical protein ABEJ85_02735 [Haloarculaceae archaeon]
MAYTWKYYDLVLLGIFGSMASGAAIGAFTPVAPTTAIIAFGLLAIAFIGHGLFVNGPVDEPRDLADEVETLN